MNRHTTTMRRHGHPVKRKARGLHGIELGALHPAYRHGRSIFPTRIFDPDEVQRVLKDGHQSRKIGRFVTKGARRGWPIFTLTLEERATCPRSCKAWAFCYGNNMQAAERIVASEPLLKALGAELKALQEHHPGGFMVRLHVLGDFYSLEYVKFWQRALDRFPALHVFGFTARDPKRDPIGAKLWAIALDRWDRFAIRFSGYDAAHHGSQLMPDHHREAIPCPAQTGATECCATCALCWASTRSIAFEKH